MDLKNPVKWMTQGVKKMEEKAAEDEENGETKLFKMPSLKIKKFITIESPSKIRKTFLVMLDNQEA